MNADKQIRLIRVHRAFIGGPNLLSYFGTEIVIFR